MLCLNLAADSRNKVYLFFTFAFQTRSPNTPAYKADKLSAFGSAQSWFTASAPAVNKANLNCENTKAFTSTLIRTKEILPLGAKGKEGFNIEEDVRIPDLSTGKARGNVGIWR